MPKYQEVLEDILKALVEHPNEVKVDKKVDEMGVLLEVNISPADAGSVIGKQGRIINAIRTIVQAAGYREQAKVNIKLLVPERSSHAPRTDRRDDFDLGRI